MRINHNIAALNTFRQMGVNETNTGKALEKLSSGLRINRAGDDAAGLAISEKMRSQIRGLGQASRNAQDGISLIQTGEGALNETTSILQRIRELAVQSGNDTNTNADRINLQAEVTQLTSEVDRISTATEFNSRKLLNGTMGAAVAANVANVNGNTGVLLSSGGTFSAGTFSTLTDSAGANLGIALTDSITITYTKNGVATTAVFNISTISGLSAMNNTDFTLSTNSVSGAMDVVSLNAGFAGAVHGLTLTVRDTAGNLKPTATNILSGFRETTLAANIQSNGAATLQIGANTGQTIALNINQMDSAALGITSLQVGTQFQASTALGTIDFALSQVSLQRANLGAVQNRLEHTVANLDTANENLTASESRIRDVDMAAEMMNFTKSNILGQASQAMLAQANQQPQGVLSLLR